MNKEDVKPYCLWCNNAMYYYYEGSHDWVFSCQKCGFDKNFYVPHLGDEEQEAVSKWHEWVREVQSHRPVTEKLWCAACGQWGHGSGTCPSITHPVPQDNPPVVEENKHIDVEAINIMLSKWQDVNKDLEAKLEQALTELAFEKNRIKRLLTTDGKGVKMKAEILAGLLEEMSILSNDRKES